MSLAQATVNAGATNTHAVPDTILGLTLRLPDPCECGCTSALIGPGSGTHPASLICDLCQAHRAWVSHSVHEFISKVIANFGRLTAPITVRRRRQASSSFEGTSREPPKIRNLTECAPAAPPEPTLGDRN